MLYTNVGSFFQIFKVGIFEYSFRKTFCVKQINTSTNQYGQSSNQANLAEEKVS